VEKPDPYQDLINVSKFNILLACIALPGYWAGVFLVEWKYTGRKRTQIGGFIALKWIFNPFLCELVLLFCQRKIQERKES